MTSYSLILPCLAFILGSFSYVTFIFLLIFVISLLYILIGR